MMATRLTQIQANNKIDGFITCWQNNNVTKEIIVSNMINLRTSDAIRFCSSIKPMSLREYLLKKEIDAVRNVTFSSETYLRYLLSPKKYPFLRVNLNPLLPQKFSTADASPDNQFYNVSAESDFLKVHRDNSENMLNLMKSLFWSQSRKKSTMMVLKSVWWKK